MILETERLILREYTYNDFNDLAKIISDPITMKHYEKPYNDEGVLRWINWSIDNYLKYGFGLWAIIKKDTNELIGDCGITLQNIDGIILPEIGYHINKNYWRNGYAKEAGKAVLNWGFKKTDFNSFYSYMTATNIASYSTAKCLGMIKVKEFYNSQNILYYVYKISKEQWTIMNN